MKISFRRQVLGLVVASVVGMGGTSPVAAEGNASPSSLNDGYSLFYDFCNQESQVSLLLWIKHTPPDLADYAKRISATAKDDMDVLKKFAAEDKALQLDKVSLPGFELDVRKSMADDRKQDLIWNNSGTAFARTFCLVQSEVTNYGLHLAKTLAEKDPDSDRGKAMRQMYDKWSALHREAAKLVP